MDRRASSARDAGLALISRINRWMIAGAVALSGVVSVAAARSFHGHTTTHAGQSAQSQPAPAPAPASDDEGSGLQQPAQAPAPAPAAPGPAVSSGGS